MSSFYVNTQYQQAHYTNIHQDRKPFSLSQMSIIHRSTFPDIQLFQGSITDFIRSGEHAGNDTKPCMIDYDTGESLTQKQILDCADQFRSLLYSQGVQKTPDRDERMGDVVIPFIDNNIYLPAIHYACLELGCCINPASTQQTALELSKQIRVTDPKVIIYQRKYKKTVYNAIDLVCYTNHPIAIEFETLLFLRNTAAACSVRFEIKTSEEARRRIAYLGMSSGTSGKSKAVRLSHSNIVSCSQVSQVTFPALYSSSNVCVAVLPSCHVFGLYIFFMVLPRSGGTTIMHTKFDLAQMLESQKKYRANFLPLVPPIAVQLAKNPLVASYRDSLQHVNLVMSAAAPLGAEITKSLVQATGPQCKVVQGYGMTETSPCVTLFDPADPDLHVRACGKLVPNCQVRIVSSEGVDQPAFHGSFNEVAKNKTESLPVGEIWVRGPQVMDGYHKNKSATLEAFVAASDDPKIGYNAKWLRTGDVGLVDYLGRFMIVDRTKEMIKSMSKQVAPAELEDMLLAHEHVSDAAVIGVEDETRGTELIRAFLVLRKGGDALEVKRWMDSRLPKYKQLHGGVVVVDQVPKSQAGKILRRILRTRRDDVILGVDRAKM